MSSCFLFYFKLYIKSCHTNTDHEICITVFYHIFLFLFSCPLRKNNRMEKLWQKVKLPSIPSVLFYMSGSINEV